MTRIGAMFSFHWCFTLDGNGKYLLRLVVNSSTKLGIMDIGDEPGEEGGFFFYSYYYCAPIQFFVSAEVGSILSFCQTNSCVRLAKLYCRNATQVQISW